MQHSFGTMKPVTIALSIYSFLVNHETCSSFSASLGKRRSRHYRVPDAGLSLSIDGVRFGGRRVLPPSLLALSASSVDASTGSFIETELRGAAMKLHTRSQAPKEGQAEEKKTEPYVTTHKDYLAFLVDSQHVYQAFEDVLKNNEALGVFWNTGLERVDPLELDIEFMVKEYGIEKPEVGKAGLEYAKLIRKLGTDGSIPEFMCHYYNFFFAHTAGGRMIGKQMSALLLNKRTLEFYKWDGDPNEIKARVKAGIEDMVCKWSQDEKDRCIGATADAFQHGGALNSYLSGGQSPH